MTVENSNIVKLLKDMKIQEQQQLPARAKSAGPSIRTISSPIFKKRSIQSTHQISSSKPILPPRKSRPVTTTGISRTLPIHSNTFGLHHSFNGLLPSRSAKYLQKYVFYYCITNYKRTSFKKNASSSLQSRNVINNRSSLLEPLTIVKSPAKK